MVNYRQFLNFPSSYRCIPYACQNDDSSVSVSPTHNYANDVRTRPFENGV